ncbi:MAG: tetratricopeptide repeat protein [Candidatus Omnitrophica bacterium]|nr:tetratricopeptide repeat protein [Candidatus Omnitrophota bacterium]
MNNPNEKKESEKPAVEKGFKFGPVLVLFLAIIFAASVAYSFMLFKKTESQKKDLEQRSSQEQEIREKESILSKKLIEQKAELDRLKAENESVRQEEQTNTTQAKAMADAAIKAAQEKVKLLEQEKAALQGELNKLKTENALLATQPKDQPKTKQEKKEEKQQEKENKAAKAEEERQLKLAENKQINDLKAQLSKVKEENSRLQGKNNQAEARIKELDKATEQLRTARKDIEGLNQKLASLKQASDKEKSDLKNSNSKLEDKTGTLQRLNTQLEDKAKGLYEKLQTADDTKYQLNNANNLLDKLADERKVLLQEIDKLKTQVSGLEKEKARIFADQGNANMQAKLFEQAIDSYETSLKLDPNNAEVNYRLGLLYKHTRDDPQKSVVYFRKYLQLQPQAKNKKEVEYLIESLSRSDDWGAVNR